MTELLNQAFEKASALPEELQNQIAQELLDEMEWESRWDRTLAASQEKLDTLAAKAAQAHRTGKTKEMGFDGL